MKTFLKSFSVVTFFALLTRGISFLFKIYLSRTLGAEILGLYQISLSVFMLLSSFSTTGIPLAISRITAQESITNNNKKIFAYLSSALVLAFVLSAIPCAFMLIFPNALNFFFQDTRCTKILLVMMPLFFTVSFYAIIRNYFCGKKDFNIFSITELLDEILKIVVAVILFSTSCFFMIDKLYTYALAMVIGDVLLIIVIIIIYIKKKGRFAPPIYFNEIIKYSAPISLQRIIATLLSSFISITLPFELVNQCGLSVSESTAEFGRASAMVMSLIMAPNAILGSLNIILIPDIAELSYKHSNSILSQKISKTILLTTFIASLFLSIFLGLGNELGEYLYKDNKVGEYLTIAAFIVIPQSINFYLISILNTTKNENKSFYTYAFSSLFLIAIIFITPKYLNIYSYFCALFVFHLVSALLNGYILNKQIPFSLTSLKLSIYIILYSIICGITAKYISNKLNIHILLKLLILGLFELILHAIPLLIYSCIKNKQPMQKILLHK